MKKKKTITLAQLYKSLPFVIERKKIVSDLCAPTVFELVCKGKTPKEAGKIVRAYWKKESIALKKFIKKEKGKKKK